MHEIVRRSVSTRNVPPVTGRPIPDPLPILAALLSGGFVASAVLLVGGPDPIVVLLAIVSAVAFGDLARRSARERSRRGGDATDVLTAAAFLAIVLGAAYDAGRRDDHVAALVIAGLAIIAFGLALRAAAARALGEHCSVRLGLREDHRLVDRGPYRWIRHPNYAALLVVAVGTSVGFASPLAAAATVGAWLPVVVLRIVREERLMLERFGGSYDRYRERTWCLVPWLV
jgi:protein-S-isoprenylcysteine O-methyltransferase